MVIEVAISLVNIYLGKENKNILYIYDKQFKARSSS